MKHLYCCRVVKIKGDKIMKKLLFIVVPLVLSTLACTSTRTNNYYTYDKPDQQTVVKDGNNSKWVNPMQGDVSQGDNIYTDDQGGGVTIVNNYYNDRNPFYQPVVVPWWNNVYTNGFWGGPFMGFSFGWNNYWGFNGFNNWFSPWYRFHPGFGLGWNTFYANGFGHHHNNNHWANNNRAREYNRRHDNYYRSPERRQISSRTAMSGSNRVSTTNGLNSRRSTYNSINRSSRGSRNTNKSNVRSSRTNSRESSSRQPSYNKGSSGLSRSGGSGYNRSSGGSSSSRGSGSSGSSSSRRGGRR